MSEKPRPIVKLVGEDGNAFSVLGRAAKAMKRAGWKKEDIDAFYNEATSGDYNHLLATVMRYCDEPDDIEPDEWYDEDERGRG